MRRPAVCAWRGVDPADDDAGGPAALRRAAPPGKVGCGAARRDRPSRNPAAAPPAPAAPAVLGKDRLRASVVRNCRCRSTWRRTQRRRRAARSCKRRSSSAESGATSSAAALGVGARTSAAKSEIVKSISWPIADTTGSSEAAIARATISSLNSHKSSTLPPPRARTITSIRGSESPRTRSALQSPRQSLPPRRRPAPVPG